MSAAQEITRAFAGDWRGTYGLIPTLGHSAKDRGTTVKDGDDGDVVFASFNGGNWREIKDECRKRGLLPERPAQQTSRRREHAVELGPGQRIVATFEFRKAGKLHYRTHRIEPGGDDRAKDFAYDHRDARGEWRPRRGPADRVPYRHDELAAADPALPIYFTEGEAKVDRLVSWGLVATSSKHWRAEFASLVKGRTCIILPDNDAAGRTIAADVARNLTAAAKVLTVDLPELPEGGDVLDWDGTAEELRALVKALLEQQSPERSVRATEYAWVDPASIPPRRFMFGRWLLRGTATAAVAAGGVGKTTFMVGMTLSLATGRSVLGQAVPEGPQRVWLWNLEDPAEELSRGIQAAAILHNITSDDVAGRLFLDSAMDGACLCTAVEDGGGFRILKPVMDELTAELIERKIDVLIIDPFVSSHAVDENSNPKIDAIAKEWGRIATLAGCSIVLVHHCRKPGGEKVTAELARGASALVNACRSALVLNRMDSEEANAFGIEGDQERRRYFTVHDDKHNRAPASKAAWFQLSSVELGNGDSVGAVQPWSPPDAFDGVKPDDLYRVQLAIAEGEWRKDVQATAWAGRAVASVLGLNIDKKADRSRINCLLKTWIENGALTTVTRDDASRRPRQFVEVGQWQNDASAPPYKRGAEQGVAPAPAACSTTTPPLGGGVSGAERAPPRGDGHWNAGYPA